MTPGVFLGLCLLEGPQDPVPDRHRVGQALEPRRELFELVVAGLGPRLASIDAIDVSFDAIEDPAERREFMEMPTTFFLPPESIDRLRELGGRLLRDSRPYQILLQRIAELAKRGAPSPVPR